MSYIQNLAADTNLVRTSECRNLFPSPMAVQSLVPEKIFNFAAKQKHGYLLMRPLDQSLLLGSGGNGIVFRHFLNGHEYAVKWVSQFKWWSKIYNSCSVIQLLSRLLILPLS